MAKKKTAKKTPFTVNVTPDWQGLRDCILRKGTPKRVHNIELFLDGEVRAEICKRYGVLDGLDPADPFFPQKQEIAVQRFLGYDFVRGAVENLPLPLKHCQTEDTADLKRAGGRNYMEEHKGPITNWREFEAYPWPDPDKAATVGLEWYEKNLPDDMCVIGFGVAHYAEMLAWMMGYESLCFALHDQRDLVRAMYDRLHVMYTRILEITLQFDRVKLIWGSDDMGFKTQPLISPADMREFVLSGHKLMARMSHEAGRPYLLHSCGNLALIMDDLIDDVRIDAKHSFEDTIENVIDIKKTYGRRIALLGGIDVDFMCRADEKRIRERVRKTLQTCMPGGGYCLGTGNSVTNYIPVDHYLAMLDEGRQFGAR